MTVTLDAPPIGAQITSATVLFVDLRGYTGLAERLPPGRVVTLLNEFFAILANATAMHGGQVFHMAGDGMMAGFGVGESDHVGVRKALAAGHAMLEQFGSVAKRWRRDLAIETGIGVGLHLGEVALGFIGPPGQQATTLVGDTVNVAARLCSRARAGEVLFSSTVAAALGVSGRGTAPVPFLQLPQFELPGRSRPLDVWCVPAPERVAI